MDPDSKPLDTDSGFELDRIDPEHLHLHQDVEQEAAAAIPPSPANAPAPPAGPARSIPRWIRVALVATSVLLVTGTAVLLFFSGKLHIDLPTFSSDRHQAPDNYVSVGPVIFSAASGDLIKMTLDINCRRKSYRKTVRDMDARIRNRAIWAFQTPKATKLLQSGDYAGLRRYLSAQLMKAFPKGMVTEIYFSQFLRY